MNLLCKKNTNIPVCKPEFSQRAEIVNSSFLKKTENVIEQNNCSNSESQSTVLKNGDHNLFLYCFARAPKYHRN
jgi:hypothetical protein